MSGLDGAIIAVYLVAMIGLSVWLGRGQSSEADYYLGGRNLPWWAVGISTMATQTSAVSFISIPAFVALAPGGGMTWLQYELAVPLAMIMVMVLLIPFFRSLELVSVYEYLELRYDRSVRLLLSGMFLVSRGLGTGVGLYASGLVLEVCLGMPLWVTILVVGVVTIIYDTIGGMAAVVWSDVVQMVVLVGGLVVSIVIAADDIGGFGAVLEHFPEQRWAAFGAGTGLGDGASAPFYGYLFGGFFLYAAYYGVDQSQAQRELSAPTTGESKMSLVLNGFARFPLTALYMVLGLTLGAVYQLSPELRAAVPIEETDKLVPQFILLMLPEGIRAILFAALLAAAMSSLDSALSSLSAATLEDFVSRPGKEHDPKRFMRLGKLITVAWGVAITAFAFVAGEISGTVVEAINKVGSAFFGPILAVFVVGVLSRRATGPGVIAGVVVGIATNLYLWLAVPSVFWMWWNLIGFAVAIAVALGASQFTPPPSDRVRERFVLGWDSIRVEERSWLRVYASLVLWFGLILGLIFWVHSAS